tara:strand:+ start:4258 stop:4935 length:678 start_codon:yes stop_codon:yes gene_type:complete
MKPLYDNLSDAQSYLSKSIVMLGKEPCYIVYVEGEDPLNKETWTIGYNLLKDWGYGEKRVSYVEADLNVKPIKGFLTNVLIYDFPCFLHVRRKPCRSFKQGLSRSNALIDAWKPNHAQFRSTKEAFDLKTFMAAPSFVDNMKNIYPSLENLEESFENYPNNPIAISRKLAIGRDNELGLEYLIRNMSKVGYREGNEGPFKLSETGRHQLEYIVNANVPGLEVTNV